MARIGKVWRGLEGSGKAGSESRGQEWIGCDRTGRSGAKRIGSDRRGSTCTKVSHQRKVFIMGEPLKREKLTEEFEAIRSLDKDGLLRPEVAVLWARQNPDSELHRKLEWDDSEAAEQWRVDQVRQLIRVIVVPSSETGQHVRAYVSQPSDRVHGGGYRPISESLAKARQELVNEALATVKRLRNQFAHLPELDPLFTAIEHDVDEYLRGHSLQAAG